MKHLLLLTKRKNYSKITAFERSVASYRGGVGEGGKDSPLSTTFVLDLGAIPSIRKVKSMQRTGTEAIRPQIQPSKPKREITYITNCQNTKRTCVQPSQQLFPKRWPLSNRKRTKTNMNTHKVKRHRNSDTKNRQQRTTTKLPPWNGQ